MKNVAFKNNARFPDLPVEIYELTLDDGKRKQVPVITTEGRLRTEREGGYFEHVVRFSDGVVQKHVVSTKFLTLPDYSPLQL